MARRKITLFDDQKLGQLFLNDREGRSSYVKKQTRQLIWILSVILLLLCLIIWKRSGEDRNSLLRPSFEEGMQTRTIEIELIKDGEKWSMDQQIEIAPRQYGAEEAEICLKEAEAYLREYSIGRNESFSRVIHTLFLPERIPQFSVRVRWEFDKNLIRPDGTIRQDDLKETGVKTDLKAVLTCSGREREVVISAVLYPKPKSEREAAEEEAAEAVRQAEREQEEEDFFCLPRTEKYRAVLKEGGSVWKIILLFPLTAAALIKGMRLQLEKEIKEKQNLMAAAYPDFVEQLLLYIRAGLTVQAAWKRMTESCRRGAKQQRYLYLEMTAALNEMENGIPVEKALEKFGKRSSLLPYIKLTFLLGQNIRKGTKELPALLEYEAKEAMEQRRSLIRKKGEEAGTKLLFPMMLMLLLVLLLLLIPAFRQL